MPQARVLWVENDPGYLQPFVDYLRESGHHVRVVTDPGKAIRIAQEECFDLALLDIVMPHGGDMDPIETHSGHRTGLVLASRLRSLSPKTKLVGVSIHTSDDVREWFKDFGHGFWLKSEFRGPRDVLRRVNVLLGFEGSIKRVFIVHGHDHENKLSLKNFLQNNLELPEPIILHERPSAGRTIIEKLEEESLESDLVFVLLTPDDPGMPTPSGNVEKRKARQNVIFELGFFYGRIGRRAGRIFLLHKGALDLPSDIAGISYVDVSQGIEAAAEQIRKEVSPFIGQRI